MFDTHWLDADNSTYISTASEAREGVKERGELPLSRRCGMACITGLNPQGTKNAAGTSNR